MEIIFLPLIESHFPLLLEWLNADHVKKWWDSDITWTFGLVNKKYTSYIEGFKLENGNKKPIHSYVFCDGTKPIGYIQYYDIRDFTRDTPLPDDIPERSAALDFYIGDSNYLNKGYGMAALQAFYKEIIWPNFDACFVDPDSRNEAARRVYESAGFEIFQITEEAVWMVKYRW